jgi:DNA-binding Lrp family transcriptional regulator
MALHPTDRAIVRATQAGLPLCHEPYRAVGEQLGLTAEEVIRRLRSMLESGLIRRIGAVPNHYALGYRANGMSVWDVEDARLEELGPTIGALPSVTHCYRRPRRLPAWPYNLFAMIHGRTREAVAVEVARIAALLGPACRGHDVLYSTAILKKAGLRLGE